MCHCERRLPFQRADDASLPGYARPSALVLPQDTHPGPFQVAPPSESAIKPQGGPPRLLVLCYHQAF